MNQRFTIVVSSPPDELPHKKRAQEIEELSEYLSIQETRDTGTDYVITEAAGRDAPENSGRIYIAKNSLTKVIEGIYSKVGGTWTRWKLTDEDLIHIPDDETIQRGEADATTGQKKLYVPLGPGLEFDEATGKVRAAVDGTSVVYGTEVDGVQKLEAVDQSEWFRGHFGSTIVLPLTPMLDFASLTITKAQGTMDVSSGKIKITKPGVYLLSYNAYIQGFGTNAGDTTGCSNMAIWLTPKVYEGGTYRWEGSTSLRSVYYPAVPLNVVNTEGGVVGTVSIPRSSFDISLDGAAGVIPVTNASETNPWYVELKASGWTNTAAVTLHSSVTGGNPFFNYTLITLARVGSAA